MTDASKLSLRRLGSYTTARVDQGRVTHVERHVVRLMRDAIRLGLEPPSPRDVESLFWETAATVFPSADGIIRLDWAHPLGTPAAPRPALTATTRPIGDLPATWRARIAETPHPGPEARRNTKSVDVPAYDASRIEMREGDVEEVLLVSAEGWLVEGCRSNLVVVQEEGDWVTPDLALGGVEGLGLEIVRESRQRIKWGRIDRAALLRAREIIATNAVRGAVPIIELEGKPVGDGTTGPVARLLASPFG